MFKKVIFFVFLCLCRIFRKVLPAQYNVLISSEIPLTNMGDQALIYGALEGILGASSLDCVVVNSGKQELSESSLKYMDTSRVRVKNKYWPFFVTNSAFFEKLLIMKLFSRAEKVYLIGADVLDGSYNEDEACIKLECLNLADSIGCKATLLGSSFQENISDNVITKIKALRAGVELKTRDPLSESRVNKYRKASLVADVAFLMREDADPNYLSLLNQLDLSRSSIGICLRDSDLKTIDIKALANCLARLVENHNCNIILIPHFPSDALANQALYDALPESISNHCITFDQVVPAPVVKALCGRCSLLISSRMHAAIAALGLGTPVLCLPYAGKFEGLLMLFGIEDGIFNREIVQKQCEEQLFTFLLNKLENASEQKLKIQQQLTEIKTLSRANF